MYDKTCSNPYYLELLMAVALTPTVLMGVTELLLCPEYGQSFLEELLVTAGETVTPEAIEELELALTTQLHSLAAPFVAQLGDEAGGYQTILDRK